MMGARVGKRPQQLRDCLENHHSVRMVGDFGENHRQIMTVRNLAGCNVIPAKDNPGRIRHVRQDFRRADTEGAQPERRDELPDSASGKKENIPAQLRHPAAPHTVPHNGAAAPIGEIDGEHRCTPGQRLRVGLSLRVLVERLLLEDLADGGGAGLGREHVGVADLEPIVRGNVNSDHCVTRGCVCLLTDAIVASSASAFPQVSSHSRSPTESATIPAPACTEAFPSVITQVRIVIARSIRFPPAAMYPTAPAYGPRDTGSSSSMISIARILGAPVMVPAGKVARKTSSPERSALSLPSTWLTI